MISDFAEEERRQQQHQWLRQQYWERLDRQQWQAWRQTSFANFMRQEQGDGPVVVGIVALLVVLLPLLLPLTHVASFH